MVLQDPVQRSISPIVTYVRSSISGFNGSTGSSATSMAYSNLLTEGPIKAIVFSQWTSMLDLVEISLNQYCMTLSSRDRAVKDCNTDHEAGNLGLNMVVACHVILLDLWWNPTPEDQAVDRARRDLSCYSNMTYHLP
ncbi:hypothetical protein Peur_015554 [Populus x canadensis]